MARWADPGPITPRKLDWGAVIAALSVLALAFLIAFALTGGF